MPSRILREGIITSEGVDVLSAGAEVFYRRAMSAVDDYGRYYAKPELLMAALYPLRPGKVTGTDIEAWIQECMSADLIVAYEFEGKRYLEIKKFRQHIRATKGRFGGSKFPDPQNATQLQRTSDADALQPRSTSTAPARLVVDVDVVECGVGTRKRREAAGTAIPDDFDISEGVRAWARRKGFEPYLEAHRDHFVNYARAGNREGKPILALDWDAKFRNAIAGDWGKVRNSAITASSASSAASRFSGKSV